MKNNYPLAVTILLTLLVGVGCGGGSGSQGATSPALAISLSSAPPASLTVGTTATIAATVTNDSANGGVDWSCTPAATCGTFSAANTASGATTTYTAPVAAGNVTIVAASHTKSTVTASANVTIIAATPAITVSLSSPPPTSLVVSTTASIAATVTNDSANAGVDWSCMPVGTCGTFSAAHTASGASTTYTAPAAAGNVSIVAASTTTNTITASANVTITTGAPTLAGNFAFFARGLETNSRVYSLVGSVTLTASGTVTAGEQDFNDGTTPDKSPAGGDTITGGAYTLGSDGRGTLTLITNNSHLGVSGTETLAIVVVNSKHVLIEQFDASATSTGSMDLQTVASGLPALSGGYAFAVVGKFGTTTEGFGGLITADGNGGLHTTVDVNEGKTITRAGTSTGSYTPEDSFGRGTMTCCGGQTFVYYAVVSDATRTKALRLLVTNTNETDLGSAFLQAENPTTFSTAMISGKFVFVESGNHGKTDGFVIAGEFSADGAGNVTSGAADESEGGTPDALATGAITGTYTLPANGVGALNIVWTNDHHTRGMYPTDPLINLLDPNNPTGGGGALLLSLDAHIGDGVMVPQGTTGTPSGSFGLSFHAFTDAGEVDGVGQVAIASGSLTGMADVNDLFHSNQATGATFSGTLTADATNPGRFTLPLTLTIGGTPTVETIIVYQISGDQFVFVQTDNTQFASGVLEIQQ